MPNSKLPSEQEPGSRSGEGASSILPHLLRQTQTQLKTPIPPPELEAEQKDEEPPGVRR